MSGEGVNERILSVEGDVYIWGVVCGQCALLGIYAYETKEDPTMFAGQGAWRRLHKAS